MVNITKLFQITSPWENWEMKCQSRAEQIFISKTNVLSKKKFPGKQCRNLMKFTVGGLKDFATELLRPNFKKKPISLVF